MLALDEEMEEEEYTGTSQTDMVSRYDEAVHRWIESGMGGMVASPYFAPEQIRCIARQRWQVFKEEVGQDICILSIPEAIQDLRTDVIHRLQSRGQGKGRR